MKHTIEELHAMQKLPLADKINLTMERVQAWVEEYGENGVYLSFSGGKDSTVLINIIRERMGYTRIPAVFVDVPTQYPELKDFVMTLDNITIIRPKISFREVCEKYGFPLISKEVSECVWGARKYLRSIEKDLTQDAEQRTLDGTERNGTERNGNRMRIGMIKYADLESTKNLTVGGYDNKYRKLRGIGAYTKRTDAQQARWEQSETCNNARNADEGSEDKGEYP